MCYKETLKKSCDVLDLFKINSLGFKPQAIDKYITY